jgi:hypothetical protein
MALVNSNYSATELWLKWNTGKSAPSVGEFVGIFAMFTFITIAASGGMIL